MKITVGATVTLARNEAFRAEMKAFAANGVAFLKVISWGGEAGGWRRKLALGNTCYHVDELVRVEIAELGRGRR